MESVSSWHSEPLQLVLVAGTASHGSLALLVI